MASSGQILRELSTSALLGSNETWESSSFLIGVWTSLNVIVKADQSGTLLVKWSGNNSITYDYSESYSIAANIEESIPLNVLSSTVQFIYTNGIIGQSYFKLYTYGCASSSIISISQTQPINVNIEASSNTVTVDSISAPMYTANWSQFDSIIFDQKGSTLGTLYSVSLPESVQLKPQFVSGGLYSNTLYKWRFDTTNVFYIRSDIAGSPMTPVDNCMAVGNQLSPGVSASLCEFACIFLNTSDTALAYESIGFGIPLLNTGYFYSGIFLCSTDPYTISTGIYGRMAIRTYYNAVVSLEVKQKDWDIPYLNEINWNTLNYIRFVFTPARVLCQIKIDADKWTTFHTLPQNIMYYCPSRSGYMIMSSQKVSSLASTTGIGLLEWNTYIANEYNTLPPSSLSSTRSIGTNKTLLVDLYNSSLWDSFPSDLTVQLKNTVITNHSTTDILLISCYKGCTISSGAYVSITGSNCKYNRTGSITVTGTPMFQFTVGPSSTLIFDLRGLRLFPGEHFSMEANFAYGTYTVYFSLNWDEMR